MKREKNGLFLSIIILLFLLQQKQVEARREQQEGRREQQERRREQQEVKCGVVIAGGTTAALAAALSSASEGVFTCLLEPTDWVGGQLTASGVSAIDFCGYDLTNPETGFVYHVHTVDTAEENVTPNFYNAISKYYSTSKCWVSLFCFLPTDLLLNGLFPLVEEQKKNLVIFYQTVVKSVQKDPTGRIITSITGIQRTPNNVSCGGYDIFPSQDLPDWYSPTPSERWHKNVIEFTGSVFIDATEWGEVLVLSNASYLQGISERFDGDTSGLGGSDTCGQAFTYDFIEKLVQNATVEPPNPYPVDYPNYYNLGPYDWDQIWIYRRSVSDAGYSVGLNDYSLQNWAAGNDYPFKYLFLNRSMVEAQIPNWMGGVDTSVMYSAERQAIGYHYWFRENANSTLQQRILIEPNEMGTCHGLAKVPYIRDTRRSIGVGNFLINISMLTGTPSPTQLTGEKFYDRVAMGVYGVDVHYTFFCDFPAYMKNLSNEKYPVLPSYIPLRAMTNRDIDNLMVAGKTMATSFLANAATRLHPTEWSSGTAAGVSAAYMTNKKISTTLELLASIESVQERVQLYTPIDWKINITQYSFQKVKN